MEQKLLKKIDYIQKQIKDNPILLLHFISFHIIAIFIIYLIRLIKK